VTNTGRLAGRRILVTGAAGGIGLATARLFAAHGAQVACVDRDADLLHKECGPLSAIRLPIDVSDPVAVRTSVESAAAAMGGLDGLVNAAGISLKKPFGETSLDEWRRVIAVNLDGPFNICSSALPFMRAAGGGTIVNIASGAGLRPLPEFSAYCASKGGLVLFSKALAIDLAADGVRVNAICPGIVRTPMVERRLAVSPDREAAIETFLRGRVMRRFGTAEEIADAALFLTTMESSFITGTALSVDGGATFH
jgi:NAD(P)-dependent dehydrogenase (short-subunit alcohol dehydrogenase family)